MVFPPHGGRLLGACASLLRCHLGGSSQAALPAPELAERDGGRVLARVLVWWGTIACGAVHDTVGKFIQVRPSWLA